QWDWPNGWAPLQWTTIIGLRRYGYHQLADAIKFRWLATNEALYMNEGKFVEKYNVVDPTELGGGGEYQLQDGFGWTNGVFLALKQGLDLDLID
ncbi:MAG TPA: trehalase family glycosidase, partial [Candidatus Saccharimonadales bacterium]|nr:trehalase family glycosidase [Candidatus Saccharimonadales bacterium]